MIPPGSVHPSKHVPRPYELVVRAGDPEADWRAIYDMREEASVRYNTMALPFADPLRFRERWTTPNPHLVRLIAEARYPDRAARVIGMLGLHLNASPENAHWAGLGIQVATDFQGQGVGSALMEAACIQADRWLNLHRLDLEVFTDNVRGIALYQRFGFAIEARLVRFAFRDGAFADAYKMGRLNPAHLQRSVAP